MAISRVCLALVVVVLGCTGVHAGMVRRRSDAGVRMYERTSRTGTASVESFYGNELDSDFNAEGSGVPESARVSGQGDGNVDGAGEFGERETQTIFKRARKDGASYVAKECTIRPAGCSASGSGPVRCTQESRTCHQGRFETCMPLPGRRDRFQCKGSISSGPEQNKTPEATPKPSGEPEAIW